MDGYCHACSQVAGSPYFLGADGLGKFHVDAPAGCFHWTVWGHADHPRRFSQAIQAILRRLRYDGVDDMEFYFHVSIY